MNDNLHPRWLIWAREIQALAQTGDHYAVNEYQRERYHRFSEIAAEIISAHSELDFPLIINAFTAQIGYATPRVDVRGAVFRVGKLLMVRERADGGWTLPGGWADVGDTPSQSAEREVWEETGFVVKARKIIGVYDANRIGPIELFHAYKLIYLCDIIGGEAKPSSETSDVAFFDQEAVPAHLSENRTLPQQIVDVFDAFQHPEKHTVFD